MIAELKLTPEVLAEAEAAEKALAHAQQYAVTTAAQYESAGGELRELAGRAKKLEAMRKDLKAPALEQCRRIDEFFKGPQDFVADAIKAIKKALGTYDAEQRRLREEAERKAAEAARKERERQAAEAAKAEAAARAKRAAEEEKARKLEEQGRIAEAEAKRAAAEEREAARLREAEAQRQAAAMLPPAPVIHAPKPEVKGISTRETWTFEIIDPMLLPREYLVPNEQAIRGVVKALKNATNIPGVRVYAETTIAARSA